MRGVSVWLVLLFAACSSESEVAATPDSLPAMTAAERYEAHCAGCHGNPDIKRAVPKEMLARLNPAQISFALTNGTMKSQGDALGTSGIIELVEHLSAGRTRYAPSPEDFCETLAIDPEPIVSRWGISPSNTAHLPAGSSTITSENVDTLEVQWVFGLPDVANARSQPVITRDTIVIAATSGHLFALDRHRGCIRWHRVLDAPPRTAITLGGSEVLYVGDVEAHVNAFDVHTGDLIWRRDVSITEHSFLTGAAIEHEQILIVPLSIYEVGLAVDPEHECCRSHGGIVALDVKDGTHLWTFHTTEPATRQGETEHGVPSWGPSGAPIWSTPTIDAERRVVYVGTGQNASQPATSTSDAIIALDLDTGAVAWQFQAIAGDAYNIACDQRPPGPNCPKWRGPDHDFGAAVMIVKDSRGHDLLIAGQKSGDVYALDPDNDGTIVWQNKVGAGSALGGIHWGMATNGRMLFLPVADPPYPIPGYRPKPGLYALDVDNGEMVWDHPVERGCKTNLFEYFARESLYPECSFFYGLSAQPLGVNDLVFSAGLDGRLRAHDQHSGDVLWQFESRRSFTAVNGIETHGGSIDVAGALAAGDFLYSQSGYAQFGQLPGNALIAFKVASLSR